MEIFYGLFMTADSWFYTNLPRQILYYLQSEKKKRLFIVLPLLSLYFLMIKKNC